MDIHNQQEAMEATATEPSQGWTDDVADTPMSGMEDVQGDIPVENTAQVVMPGTTGIAMDVIDREREDLNIPEDALAAATILNNLHEAAVADPQPVAEPSIEDANQDVHNDAGENDTHNDQDTSANDEAARALEVVERAEAEAARAAADLTDIQTRTEECTVCYEDLPLSNILLMACGEHWICKDHIKDYFQRAVDNQANYPPRCCDACGRIELNVVDHWLPDELIAVYLFKVDEYQTDVRLRCYCADKDCHTFLPPNIYQDVVDDKHTVADCRKCHRSTCVVCKTLVSKEEAHDCKAVVLNVTNQAYESSMRFKACPFCGRFGQLDEACNHVTCLGENCHGEWCFVCVEAWNSGQGHHECQQYGDPTYDEEGYDERGFHRDTGFNRDGFTRGGYNIRGRDETGERMSGFAERIAPGNYNHRNTVPGFANLDEDELRDSVLIQVISEQALGILPADANLEQEINERVSAITGGGRPRLGGRGRGGFRGRGRGGFGQGGHMELAQPDEEEVEPDDELENNRQGVEDHHEVDNQEERRVADLLDVVDDQEAPVDENAAGDNGELGNDDNVAQDQPNDAGVDQVEGNDIQGEQQENRNNEDGVDNHPGLEAAADIPATPTPAQRRCAHAFELREGGRLCSVCRWHTDEGQNSFHFLCDFCQAITCGNCSFEYQASVLMNWPDLPAIDEVEEGGNVHDEEGAHDGQDAAAPANQAAWT
jgi:hypothetical protein